MTNTEKIKIAGIAKNIVCGMTEKRPKSETLPAAIKRMREAAMWAQLANTLDEYEKQENKL